MADAVFDSTEMVRQLFREGQRVTDEAGDALPQCVLEGLERIGVAGVLRHGFGWRRGTDPGVDRLLIRIECRLLTVHRWQVGPHLWRTRVAAIPDVEGQDWPCLLVPGAPPPGLVRFLRPQAPQRIGCDLQTSDEPLPGHRDRQPRPRSRSGRQTGDEKAPKPPDTDASCPANAMEGNLLAAQAFHEGALLCAHHPLGCLEDKWATTRLAVMVLRPSWQMPSSFAALRTTCWTRFSHDPNALLPP